uniref:Secreted protein n=1 Tax=Streptomyces sp. NBC_01401 TaxID=2903854 RepID=A0AAU3GT03_9ACTN
MVRRQMRFAAVLVVVVLALTGFSTSSHGGKSGKSRSGKSSSSGGGCSNSKKSNGSYHHYDDDDDYDSSSSTSGGSTYESATPAASASDAPAVRVIRCAQPKKGKRRATTSSSVEIRSTSSVAETYEVDVTFVDAKGLTVDTGDADVEVGAGETKVLTVAMDSPRLVSRVKGCRATADVGY